MLSSSRLSHILCSLTMIERRLSDRKASCTDIPRSAAKFNTSINFFRYSVFSNTTIFCSHVCATLDDAWTAPLNMFFTWSYKYNQSYCSLSWVLWITVEDIVINYCYLAVILTLENIFIGSYCQNREWTPRIYTGCNSLRSFSNSIYKIDLANYCN